MLNTYFYVPWLLNIKSIFHCNCPHTFACHDLITKSNESEGILLNTSRAAVCLRIAENQCFNIKFEGILIHI